MEEAGNALLLLVPFVQVATRDQETFCCVWFCGPTTTELMKSKNKTLRTTEASDSKIPAVRGI